MRRLNLSPIPLISLLTAFFLLLIPFFVILAAVMLWPSTGHPSGGMISQLMVPLVLVALVDALVLFCLAKNTVWEERAGLRIQAMGFLHKQIYFEQVDWGQARFVDFRTERSLRPRWRTMGMGLPGYQSGYFRLVNKQKCFAICRGSEAVYLPLLDGTAVLLSLADGHAWLRRHSGVYSS